MTSLVTKLFEPRPLPIKSLFYNLNEQHHLTVAIIALMHKMMGVKRLTSTILK